MSLLYAYIHAAILSFENGVSCSNTTSIVIILYIFLAKTKMQARVFLPVMNVFVFVSVQMLLPAVVMLPNAQ